jgi:hypothetical protein
VIALTKVIVQEQVSSNVYMLVLLNVSHYDDECALQIIDSFIKVADNNTEN